MAIYDKAAENEEEIIDKFADYKINSFDEIIKALCLEYGEQPE